MKTSDARRGRACRLRTRTDMVVSVDAATRLPVNQADLISIHDNDHKSQGNQQSVVIGVARIFDWGGPVNFHLDVVYHGRH